jgi:hypothetical protein
MPRGQVAVRVDAIIVSASSRLPDAPGMPRHPGFARAYSALIPRERITVCQRWNSAFR